MPNPGFYHQVWEDRGGPRRRRTASCATWSRMLRERKQRVSTADLIAAEASARGLAAPARPRRGLAHRPGGRHHRGAGQGRAGAGGPPAARRRPRGAARRRARLLAAGTVLPPLVQDMKRQLRARADAASQGARGGAGARGRGDRAAAGCCIVRCWHRRLHAGGRHRLRQPRRPVASWERWRIAWRPDRRAVIEAARYGPAWPRPRPPGLAEQAARSSAAPAGRRRCCSTRSLAGLDALAGALHERLAG